MRLGQRRVPLRLVANTIEGVGGVPVVTRAAPSKVVGMLTRSDVLSTNKVCLEALRETRRVLHIARRDRRRGCVQQQSGTLAAKPGSVPPSS